MRKIFSLVLVATALLFSMQAKAADPVAELWIGGTKTDIVTDLNEALSVISAVPNTEATIKLLQDANLTPTGSTDALSGLTDRVSLNNGEKITIQLNGKNLAQSLRFNLVHASIYLKNDSAVGGNINTTIGQPYNTYGSSNANEPYGFSDLYIGANVTLSAPGQYVIGIFPNDYLFKKNTGAAYMHGPGAGVTVDIYGTVISGAGISTSGQLDEKTGNVPVINIYAGAQLIQDDKDQEGAAVYAGGYAKWNIYGYVEGECGIYAKAGEINIIGGTVTATASVEAGQYQTPEPYGNGMKGGAGSAIVLDSKEGYAGNMTLNVSGDATIIASENAYAIDELKTDATATKTDAIVISGGTINGDINTTAEVKDDCKLNGSITGGTFSDQTIKDYIPNVNGVIEVTTGAGGETVYVVNGMPSGKTWETSIADAGKDSYVKVAAGKKQTISENKEVAYLNVPGKDTLVVTNGATFSIGEAVLGSDAVLEVEPGSKVIIEETNGVIAFEPENLIIKANAEDGMATFLINPDVKANKSPKATIEFMTNAVCGKKDNSIVSAPNDYKWEMIASPFVKIDTIISEVSTFYERIEDGAFVQRKKKVIIDETLPFEMIAICPDAEPKEGGYKYTFIGTLQGANDLSDFEVVKKFNYLGNAYTAKMDAEEMISELKEGESAVRSVVYLWKAENMKWQVYNSYELPEEIKPMAAFVLFSDADGTVGLDYEKLIWDANIK